MTRHTPGPWIVKIQPDFYQVHAYSPGLKDDVLVCRVGHFQSEKNAELISAAPEMLDALCRLLKREGVVEYLKQYDIPALIAAENAVAKAVGRE